MGKEKELGYILWLCPKNFLPKGSSQFLQQTFVCCFALGCLALFNTELCCFVQPKSNVNGIGLWAACHISKDLKHKALHGSEKTLYTRYKNICLQLYIWAGFSVPHLPMAWISLKIFGCPYDNWINLIYFLAYWSNSHWVVSC